MHDYSNGLKDPYLNYLAFGLISLCEHKMFNFSFSTDDYGKGLKCSLSI